MKAFRFVAVAVVTLALAGCASMPWQVDNSDLSAAERSASMELGSVRAQVAVSTRLSATERTNLGKTLDTAESDLTEARNLLSLEMPPLDRVEAYVESAKGRIESVRQYLKGV